MVERYKMIKILKLASDQVWFYCFKGKKMIKKNKEI